MCGTCTYALISGKGRNCYNSLDIYFYNHLNQKKAVGGPKKLKFITQKVAFYLVLQQFSSSPYF